MSCEDVAVVVAGSDETFWFCEQSSVAVAVVFDYTQADCSDFQRGLDNKMP